MAKITRPAKQILAWRVTQRHKLADVPHGNPGPPPEPFTSYALAPDVDTIRRRVNSSHGMEFVDAEEIGAFDEMVASLRNDPATLRFEEITTTAELSGDRSAIIIRDDGEPVAMLVANGALGLVHGNASRLVEFFGVFATESTTSSNPAAVLPSLIALEALQD